MNDIMLLLVHHVVDSCFCVVVLVALLPSVDLFIIQKDLFITNVVLIPLGLVMNSMCD